MWDYLISTLAIQHMSLDTFYRKHYLYQNYFRSHKTPRIHLKINTTSKHVKEKPGWLSRKRGGSRLSFRASNPKYHSHFFSFFKTSIYCLLAQIKYTNSFSRLHLSCLFYNSADVCTMFYSAYMYGRRQERERGGGGVMLAGTLNKYLYWKTSNRHK